ncbi:hypothetical protein CFOL_v3_34045, partial [Cephalotus follicularis]
FEEEEDRFEEEVNPFNNIANRDDRPKRSRLEERLVRALDFNSGIQIEVPDFHGKMHADDFFDWESSLENYYDWKPMSDDRKVLFVKLKLKGTTLLWWKRLQEHRIRQGKQRIRT